MAMNLSDDEKIAVVRKMIAAWDNKEWRACADMLAVDGVLRNMMLEPVVGREAFYQRISGPNMSAANKKATLHIDLIGVIDGAVVVERRDEITVDGVTNTVPVVGILRFDGPLVSEWRDYYDRAQLLNAQGKAHLAALDKRLWSFS